MRFAHMHRISSQGIDDLKVLLEHVRVLLIFAGDVLFNCGREGEAVRFAEREEEDVAIEIHG